MDLDLREYGIGLTVLTSAQGKGGARLFVGLLGKAHSSLLASRKSTTRKAEPS